jgi:hypothetical protein
LIFLKHILSNESELKYFSAKVNEVNAWITKLAALHGINFSKTSSTFGHQSTSDRTKNLVVSITSEIPSRSGYSSTQLSQRLEILMRRSAELLSSGTIAIKEKKSLFSDLRIEPKEINRTKKIVKYLN